MESKNKLLKKFNQKKIMEKKAVKPIEWVIIIVMSIVVFLLLFLGLRWLLTILTTS